MKKITIVIGILLLASSCVTQKKCLQKFPPQIITKDSVVLKDTTIYIPVRIEVPGDSVHVTDSIPCPDVEYHKEVKSTSGRTSAKVDISKGKLSVNCKTDSLTAVIDSLEARIKVAETYHSEVKVVEKPIEKTPLWVWFVLGISILYAIFPLISKIFK